MIIFLTETYVKLFGDLLSSPLLQLPSSPSTIIAITYNIKTEAAPHETHPQGQAPGLSEEESPSDPPSTVDDTYIEWDTIETVNAVKAAIEERYAVAMIEANEHAFERLRQLRPAFVFNMAEGLHGVSREAQVPAMLEMLQIPYLGSDPLTLSICLDKARTKEILSFNKIPTAGFGVIRSMEEFEDARVRFPAMVKPLHEGSSKGIFNSCVVKNADELKTEVKRVLTTYGEPALVEDYLPGREFTVGILGNGEKLQVLPAVEIKFDALPAGVNPIYSFEAKWVWDRSEHPLEIFECPASLSDALSAEIEKTCRNAFRVLGCRDWSRIDLRLDASGVPAIIEVNPLPGILPRPEDNSCLPKAARATGMSYNELINTALDIAMERCGVIVPINDQRTIAVGEEANG